MLIDGINVLKKQFIDVYAEELQKIPEIKGLIIFGSAVTDRCREDSDIDCILVCNKNVLFSRGVDIYNAYVKAAEIKDTEQDILTIPNMETFYTKQTLLYETIRNSGEYKIIFERD